MFLLEIELSDNCIMLCSFSCMFFLVVYDVILIESIKNVYLLINVNINAAVATHVTLCYQFQTWVYVTHLTYKYTETGPSRTSGTEF